MTTNHDIFHFKIFWPKVLQLVSSNMFLVMMFPVSEMLEKQLFGRAKSEILLNVINL